MLSFFNKTNGQSWQIFEDGWSNRLFGQHMYYMDLHRQAPLNEGFIFNMNDVAS
jgi:hypothetical protein